MNQTQRTESVLSALANMNRRFNYVLREYLAFGKIPETVKLPHNFFPFLPQLGEAGSAEGAASRRPRRSHVPSSLVGEIAPCSKYSI